MLLMVVMAFLRRMGCRKEPEANSRMSFTRGRKNRIKEVDSDPMSTCGAATHLSYMYTPSAPFTVVILPPKFRHAVSPIRRTRVELFPFYQGHFQRSITRYCLTEPYRLPRPHARLQIRQHLLAPRRRNLYKRHQETSLRKHLGRFLQGSQI